MKLTLELYNTKYTVEQEGRTDYTANELKEIFSRMLVAASFPPSVLELEDGGHFEHVGDNKIVVRKEEIENGE